jgi:hypothetical protein
MGWALIGSDDPVRCSPADPSICGPDYLLPVTVTLAFVTPVFIYWTPVLGCLLGVAVGVLAVALDPDPATSLPFGAFAVCCAATGAWFLTATRRQRMLADEAARCHRVVLPPRRQQVGEGGRLLGAGGLALVGVVLFTVFGVTMDRAHTPPSGNRGGCGSAAASAR